MTSFDPFTATLESALEQPNAHAMHGAVQQWDAAQHLLRRREYFEGHPLDGMASCAVAGLAAPDWLARAYLRCYRKVVWCEVGSWDEAFGAPYPGKKVALLRRRRTNRVRVVDEVRKAIAADPHAPIDDAFWEKIGVAVGEGKSQAQKLHAEAIALGLETWSASELRGTAGRTRPSPTKPRKAVGRLRKG